MNIKRISFLAFILCCLYDTSQGQSCRGILGEAIKRVSFGTASNPHPPLTSGMTSYTYVASDCPEEGEYTFRSTTSKCFADSWYSVSFDHTPSDGFSGLFMEVNASDLGDIYVDKVSGLCPNTTYELSFYIMNIDKPTACGGEAVDPNILFSVETDNGNTIASAVTGVISTKDGNIWDEYSMVFKLPAGSTSATIRLKNNSNSGCGNNFLLDDIALRPCGPSIVAQVASSSSSTGGACEGDTRPILLTAIVGEGLESPEYQWQESLTFGSDWKDIPGATAKSFSRTGAEAGVYLYRMLAGERTTSGLSQCRFTSNQVTINIEKAPFAQGTNYSSCLGKDVTLFAAGGEKYAWTGPNGFTANVQSPIITNVQFRDSGTYRVEVTTTNGCKGSYFTRLTIAGNPIAVAGPEVSICEGSSTPLSASGGTSFLWHPSEGLSADTIPNPIASPSDSTVYMVSVFSNGCEDTASVRVNVWKKPVADAGPDKRLRKGQSVSLTGSVKGSDFDFFWTSASPLSNARMLTPVISTEADAEFTLHAVSTKGCGESSDTTTVRVYEKIYVPNAFSPNGDGINDVWVIDPLDLFDDSYTKVFNRYGQVVFASRGYSRPWDGTHKGEMLPAGTYYYTIQLKDEGPISGWIYLVR